MNRTLLPLALTIAALAAGPCIQAVSAATTLSGRVSDSRTNLPLAGTRVSIATAGLETYADRDGSYTLAGVPAGAQQVAFSYVGYNDLVLNTTLAEGSPGVLNAAFGGVDDEVNLPEFTIVGSVVGTARAINQERAALTLTNISAADEIGSFPDQNAAESLQRLPGVALYRDQGEGRYVVLRGLNYTFTNVQFDGSSFAGADMGERATALDVVPNDALASIEVTKVPTPDMDGEGLAGIVNLRSKSAFDFDGTAAGLTVQTKYSDITGKFGYKLNGYFSTRFGEDGQYGFIISPSIEKRDFASYNFETGGSSGLVGGPSTGVEFYAPEELDFRDYEVVRERKSLSAGFEAQISENTSAFIRGSFNSFVDTENRFLTRFTAGAITAVDENSYTTTGGRISARRLRVREKDQEVFSLLAGGQSEVGRLKIDTSVGYTAGREDRPNEITGRYRPGSATQTITVTSGNGIYSAPVITQSGGPGFADTAAYSFQRIDLAVEEGEETSYDFRFNARYDLETSVPAYLKAGLAYRAKEKVLEAEAAEITYVGAPNLAASNIGPGDYPYLRIDRPSPAGLKDLLANGTVNEFERLFEDSEANDWQSDEDVLATYLMGAATFGKLNVVAGSRFEFTDFTARGNILDLDAETSTPSSASRDYTNVLPGVYLRYDASERLVFRASWSNSIARPDFGQTAFNRIINSEDGEVAEGNPFLEELTSENLDASVEYYLPSLGVISAAIFHKSVENFSYETSIKDGFATGDPDEPFYDLNTHASDASGTIRGLELAYQQRLGFLPGQLGNLSALANITFLDAEAEYGSRPGEQLDFIGQSDYVGNLGLTYETKKFFARIAMNLRGERLREDEPAASPGDPDDRAEPGYNEPAYMDLYVDKFAQLDLNLRYEFNKKFEIFAELLNITDEPFRVFQKNDPTSGNGAGKRFVQFEEYGWSANFGLRWKM